MHWSALKDYLSDAASFTLIGAPAAIVRTFMRKEFTIGSFLANGASCAFVAPLAGWSTSHFFPPDHVGKPNGMVFVIIGVSTLLGKDLIEGVLREAATFRRDPRATAQTWITFWKTLFVPAAKP